MIADVLRWLGPPLAAAATALLFDLRIARRAAAGIEPAPPGWARPARRVAAGGLLAALLCLALFASLALPGGGAVPDDLEALPTARLFLVHGLLVGALGIWIALGWAAAGRRRSTEEPLEETEKEPVEEPAEAAGRGPLAFLRLRTADLGRELALGGVGGLVIWVAALGVGALALLALRAAGAEALLPTEAPPLIVLVAGQPVWARVGVSLSAGMVEELFFRGFLQPRLGIGLSTVLFVLAHAAYGAPAMLITVTFLSLAYAGLARWRRSVWAAATAHALFDGVQLLVVLPAALELVGGAPAGP